MSNKKIIPAVVAAASMAFGFCQAVHAKSPVPGKPGTQDIVEIAASMNAQSGEFDYLLAAATCEYFEGANVELPTGSDKLTIFAPTDAAFEELQRKLGVATPEPGGSDTDGRTWSGPTAQPAGIAVTRVYDMRRNT